MERNIFFKNQPKIFGAIKAGFKTMAENAYLLLIPIAVDLLLLFSPRLTVNTIAQRFLQTLQLPSSAAPDVETLWTNFIQLATEFFRFFSIGSAVRTYPVGVPSLLAGQVLTESPLGSYTFYDFTSAWGLLAILLLIAGIGLLLGAIYFQLAANLVRDPSHKKSFTGFGHVLLSLAGLPLVLFLAAVFVGIPALFIIALLNLISSFLGLLAYIVIAMVLLSLFLPLIFTPHVIVFFKQSLFKSILTSVKLVRQTYSATSIFILIQLTVVYFTNLLWLTPSDNSWLTIVGIFGHAVITTAFMLSSYHFLTDLARIAQGQQNPTVQA